MLGWFTVHKNSFGIIGFWCIFCFTSLFQWYTDSGFSFLQEPISEAAAVLVCYPGICPVWSYGTVLFDGCFPYSVCYVKSFCQTLSIQIWLHILLWLPELFRVGVMKMYIFQSFRHCRKKQNMYCTNVRNYVIKIHVFDYLTMAVTFVWIWKQLVFMNVISTVKQLFQLALNHHGFLKASHASFLGSTIIFFWFSCSQEVL